MTSQDTAHAPAGLTIEVYTTPGRPFASAATPEGPGDDPTWSPSSATLIYGDHDAVLVDTLITYDQVDALADWIAAKGRRPSRIYITHGHGDHWLGLARLTQRFPGATGLATAEVLAQAADPAMAGYWEALFPGEIPGAGAKVLPGRQRTAGHPDRPGRHRALHRPACPVAGRRRHRRPGLQRRAHDDRRDR
jgi:glyoxylase-like metal-dependent hydrolase (beta-lactamase superfamily II)